MVVQAGEKHESQYGELLGSYTPAPLLQGFVKGYYFYCAPASFLSNRHVVHIPTGDAWLCLHLWRSKLIINQGSSRDDARMLFMSVCSITQVPVTSLVSEDPAYACLFIGLRPWAISCLFPDVSGRGRQQIGNLQPLLSSFYLNSYNQVAATGKAYSFVCFVDDGLQSQMPESVNDACSCLEFICHYSELRKGELTVEQLAEKSAISYRTLHRLFIKYLGVCPKMYLRILRFKHVCRLLIQGHLKQKTQLAYQCGYYDQPHFNHEFRQVLACAPYRFIRFFRKHCKLPFGSYLINCQNFTRNLCLHQVPLLFKVSKQEELLVG